MKTLKELLSELKSQYEFIEWVNDKTIEQVVKECDRGGWLMFLVVKLELDRRKAIATNGHIANTVRHLMKDERSVKYVDLCMNFEDTSISFEELKTCASDAMEAVSYFADYYDDKPTLSSYDAEHQLQTANIVRERLGKDIINKVNQLLNN